MHFAFFSISLFLSFFFTMHLAFGMNGKHEDKEEVGERIGSLRTPARNTQVGLITRPLVVVFPFSRLILSVS